MNKIDLQHLASYEEDFALWSAEQAALLRAGKLDRVDIGNVAEEIESLGKSEKKEIRSRLLILIMHLLKWQWQPAERSRSWAATIRDQRDEIADLLAESPSLRGYPGQIVESLYPRARERAADETSIFPGNFPEACPFTIDQILDRTYLPGKL